jgi:hypothetical protein
MLARRRSLGLLLAALLSAALASCVGPGLEPPQRDLSESPRPGSNQGGSRDGGAAKPPPVLEPNPSGSVDTPGEPVPNDASIGALPDSEMDMDAGGP